MNKTVSRKIFLLLIIILSVQSCKNKDVDVEITPLSFTKFPEASEVYRIEERCYYNPFILDSFLIVSASCNLDGEVKRFHVFNKNNLQLITTFGTIGLARFEFPGRAIPLTTTNLNTNNILYYDTKIWQIKSINLDKLLLGGIISDCVTSIPIEKDLMDSDEIRIFDDHRFVGINTTPQSEGMFFIYDSQRKSMKWIEPVPKVKGIDDRHKVFLHNGVFSVNSSKKSIVYATRYYDQVLFYDLSGKLRKQHVFSPLEKPELSAQQITPVMGSFLYAVSVLKFPSFSNS